jgi:hypothetical protein
MSLLYIANKLIDNSEIKFTKPQNTTEKALATFGKFKYESTLLGLETGFLLGAFMGFLNHNAVKKTYSCHYYKPMKIYVTFGYFIGIGISLYRAKNYINNPDKKIIDFA